jgi:hypothetical protein
MNCINVKFPPDQTELLLSQFPAELFCCQRRQQVKAFAEGKAISFVNPLTINPKYYRFLTAPRNRQTSK